MDFATTYTIRRVSDGEIVGRADSQRQAEDIAQGMAEARPEALAVVEVLTYIHRESRCTMSIVGSTGVLLRLA